MDEITELFSLEEFEELLNETEPMVELFDGEYGFGTVLKQVDYVSFYEHYTNYCDRIDPDEM